MHAHSVSPTQQQPDGVATFRPALAYIAAVGGSVAFRPAGTILFAAAGGWATFRPAGTVTPIFAYLAAAGGGASGSSFNTYIICSSRQLIVRRHRHELSCIYHRI